MKVSVLYSLAPILAIVEAATLNVGSGKTYTTVALPPLYVPRPTKTKMPRLRPPTVQLLLATLSM